VAYVVFITLTVVRDTEYMYIVLYKVCYRDCIVISYELFLSLQLFIDE